MRTNHPTQSLYHRRCAARPLDWFQWRTKKPCSYSMHWTFLDEFWSLEPVSNSSRSWDAEVVANDKRCIIYTTRADMWHTNAGRVRAGHTCGTACRHCLQVPPSPAPTETPKSRGGGGGGAPRPRSLHAINSALVSNCTPHAIESGRRTERST